MLIHHGVRGSIPCANPETSKYGGSTPCVEIITEEATEHRKLQTDVFLRTNISQMFKSHLADFSIHPGR